MSDMIIIYLNKSICALLTNAGLSGSISLPSTTPFSYICGRASIDLTAALFGVHSLGLHTALPQLTYLILGSQLDMHCKALRHSHL